MDQELADFIERLGSVADEPKPGKAAKAAKTKPAKAPAPKK